MSAFGSASCAMDARSRHAAIIAALLLAGIGALQPGHRGGAGPPSQPVLVTITDKGCEPNSLTVAAGKTTFRIKNQSRRALEWEILDGVMVVEERENIIPGFVQSLTATLAPGQYQMTCGLLNNPEGRAHRAGEPNTQPAAPSKRSTWSARLPNTRFT